MERRPDFGLETWAEAVLEVPFNPALYQPECIRPPHRLLPVQIFAQRYLGQEFADTCRPDAIPRRDDIIAIQQHIGEQDLHLLRNYVGMAHNMAEAAQRLQRETYESDGLRARAEYQYATTKTILSDMQMVRVPATQPRLPSIEQALQTGVVVVAPCGFGKTWVGAHAMAGAGVGRRHHPEDPEPVQGLVVVPSIDRLYEYSEETDANIFRTIIGMDVPVGLYYGKEKNIQPVTIITEASLRNVIESGGSPLGRTGVVLFDEVHHGTSPKNMAALQAISGALLGLTATPARSQMRDIRRHFPHVEVGSLRKFTELGILNRARLLTYRALEGESGMERSAVALAEQWLRQGRRVVIYAPRKGDEHEEHATDRIANEINRRMGAEVVGAARSAMGSIAQETVQAFRKKRLQGLVTVNMVSVGSNVEADTLIACGPIYSETSYMQKTGRAMRPTEKETILAEIWPHTPPARQMVTLAMLFGIENFRQGMLVGLNPGSRHRNHEIEGGRVREATDAQAYFSAFPPMSPEEIRSYSVGYNAILSLEPLPEGWLDRLGMMRRYNSTEEYIQSVLDAAGLGYRRLRTRPGIKRQYWYGPETIAYLDEHPPMQVCGDTFKTFDEVSELLDIPEWLIQHLCDMHQIPREDKLVEQLAQQKCLSDEAINQLMDVLHELPTAEVDKDVSLDSITGLVGQNFSAEYIRRFGAQPHIMRFAEDAEVQGYGYFVTQAQAEDMLTLHAAQNQRQGLTSLKEIAQQTGNSVGAIEASLRPEEEATIVFRRAPGRGIRTLWQYVPDEHADAIVRRETLDLLPDHFVARPALKAFFAAPHSKIVAELTRVSDVAQEYKGRFVGNRTITGYVRWDAVRQAAGCLPVAAAFANIDLDRLQPERLASENDEDLARADQLYARLLQATLMPWYKQDTWHSIDEATLALQCVRHVIDAFCDTPLIQDNPQLMCVIKRQPMVNFRMLLPIFKDVVAAPQRSFMSGWRTHDFVVKRVESKGGDRDCLRFPSFSGNRGDMIVARELTKGRLATIMYDKLLAERVFRRALANTRTKQAGGSQLANRWMGGFI